MASMMPKTKNTIAVHAIGMDILPVWNGPGLNLACPHTTLARIGISQARLFPATANENTACAAAGAINVNKPSIIAAKTQPQTVRSGMYPNLAEMGRKKLLKGKAPSREKAHAWREAATRMERPMRNWTMKRRVIMAMVPCFPKAS